MSTVYDASMGVRVSKSDTEGWTYQYWWTNDYTWRKLVEGSTKMLIDIKMDKLERLPEDLRKDLVDGLKDILKDRDPLPTPPVTPMPELTTEQISTALAEMKAELFKKQNEVEIKTVEQFLNNIGQSWAVCELFDIKLFDSLGEVRIPDAIAMALRVHGHYVMELHFPDGDKYEIVMRHREGTDEIRSFAYKL